MFSRQILRQKHEDFVISINAADGPLFIRAVFLLDLHGKAALVFFHIVLYVGSSVSTKCRLSREKYIF